MVGGDDIITIFDCRGVPEQVLPEKRLYVTVPCAVAPPNVKVAESVTDFPACIVVADGVVLIFVVVLA